MATWEIEKREVELYCRLCLESLKAGDTATVVVVNGEDALMHTSCDESMRTVGEGEDR